MATFDEVVATATRRLRLDRELELEIARELRTHLEDSQAEYLAAGYPPDEARDQAVKHLGDPDRLATDLYLANRYRLRLRAVLKWTAQIAMVPAAVAVAVFGFYQPWNTIATVIAHLEAMTDVPGYSASVSRRPLDYSARELACLAPDQRWVLLGDPNAKTGFERARSIVQRWPDNPIYYGDYVNWAVMEYRDRNKGKPAEAAASLLPLLDRGEQIEPCNGYYNFYRAFAAINRAGEITYSTPTPSTQGSASPDFVPDKLELRDVAAMRQALAEISRANSKSLMTSHAVDMVQLRVEMLPPPRTLLELLHRYIVVNAVLLPDLGDAHRLARSACAYACLLAEHGHIEEASGILRNVSIFGSKRAADGETLISVLVGHSIAAKAANYKQYIAQHYGPLSRAEEAAAEEAAVTSAYDRMKWGRKVPFTYLRTAGSIGRYFLGWVPDFQPDLSSIRIAEQAVAQRAGFGAIMAGASLLLIPGAMLSLCLAMFVRCARNAPLVFVGWRRIGWIVLVAVFLPLLLYDVYSFTPIANRDFSAWYMPERFLVELLVLALAITVLLTYAIRRAIHERAAELGFAVPKPEAVWRRRARLGLLVLVGFAVAIYIGGWQFESFRPTGRERLDLNEPLDLNAVEGPRTLVIGGWILVWAICLVMLDLLARPLAGFIHLLRRNRPLAFVSLRTAVPILAAVVIVLVGISHVTLRYAEAAALSHISGPQDLTFFNEVQASAYRELQAFHAQRLAQLTAGSAATTAPSLRP